MMGILLGFGVLSVAYGMAVRWGVLEPGTVNPFTSPTTSDPTAETLAAASELVKTSAPIGRSWQSKTLTNLRQVEDLLDSLESHGIEEREVQILGESSFSVRWR
jgi:hypothetical protein